MSPLGGEGAIDKSLHPPITAKGGDKEKNEHPLNNPM